MTKITSKELVLLEKCHVTVHYLKTWPEHYDDVESGRKKAELRKNDRKFKVGDYLVLQRWEPNLEQFTGENELLLISHVLHGGSFGLETGHAMLSFYHPDLRFLYYKNIKT
ncbi:MAG: DUF3850 domain-containing protein [Dyadobacter sp.]|uniref:DUF3850 domain-containing protein n=1 Tax=Dyadobacter sp. TaxID=1914288 RepID=UPI001AFFBF7A|nr:DUF3850 domain-containing protein [Dyadobacter sp.]MBO9615603.1 DUF3850 domain-containing protein [Dyadobacter sp.]